MNAFHLLAGLAWLAHPATALAQAGPNLLVNGDFENHSNTTCLYNLSNASLTATLPGVEGYGSGNEIDLMTGVCYGTAVSGLSKLAIHYYSPTHVDEFSIRLSQPVVAGGTYGLSYWAISDTSFAPNAGTVEIGLSGVASSFGAILFSDPLTTVNVWTQFQHSFVAPVSGAWLTVRAGAPLDSWLHVDGFVLQDTCGTPVTYCTAKVNSFGCTPAIASSGTPSASATSGFTVSCANVRNNKLGLLLYGTSGRAATPFQNGTLCVLTPLKRTPGTSSGGTPIPAQDCTGVYSIDMNCFASGDRGGHPLPALGIAGTQVNCQWWGRDPGFLFPNNTTLSNGLEFVVCP